MPRTVFPLATQRLLLRPFTEDDLVAVHAIEQREDVARYLYTEPRTLAETQDSLQRRVAMTVIDEEHDALRLAVTLRESDTLVGDIGIHRVSREHLQGEVGFMFHPDHHGYGYATEAVRPLLRIGFEEVGFHRIIGRCDGRNGPSARLMERLGMRREAHLRENEFIKGEWTDEFVYAILASEWKDRTAG